MTDNLPTGADLAVLAGNGRFAAAAANTAVDQFAGEETMHIAYRTDIRVAGIGLHNSLSPVGHLHHLLYDDSGVIRQRDEVAIAFGHLAPIKAWKLGRGGEENIRFRQNDGLRLCIGSDGQRERLATIELVEAARDLAGKFDVADLILTYGNKMRLIEQDVRRLKKRISEKAVGVQVFSAQLFLLILVRRNTLQPAQRRDHAEKHMELRVLRNVRLNEDGALFGIESGTKKVERDLHRVLVNLRRIGIVRRESVDVCDEEVALVLLLQADPVVEGSHVVAEVEAARGAHAGENTFARG